MIDGLHPGVTTVELDNLAAETAATMTTKHPDYAVLAARIAVSNLHKETKKVFTGIHYSNDDDDDLKCKIHNGSNCTLHSVDPSVSRGPAALSGVSLRFNDHFPGEWVSRCLLKQRTMVTTGAPVKSPPTNQCGQPFKNLHFPVQINCLPHYQIGFG